MDITVLAYLEPDEKEPDVAVQQVADGLTEAGHKTSILTIRHDVEELIRGLKARKPQLVFNLVESFGDDILGGVIGVAGVLDLLQLPYTGGGPGEIFLQEDKALTKKLLAFEGIPYPDFATFPADANFETGGNLRMPLFVKPLRMDASIGIDERSLVRNTQQMMERVLYIQRTFGDAALAEEYIEGREFYVGVMGNDELVAFPPIEMDFSGLKEGSLKVMHEGRHRRHRRRAQSQAAQGFGRRLSRPAGLRLRPRGLAPHGNRRGLRHRSQRQLLSRATQRVRDSRRGPRHAVPAGRRRHREARDRALEASQPRAEAAQEGAQRRSVRVGRAARQQLGCSPLLFAGRFVLGSDVNGAADAVGAGGGVGDEVSGKYEPR
jgi:hypothetical protein